MREKMILKKLLESKQYCNLEFLANELKVSTRTISSDIKYLMKISKKHGYEILLKRGEGYYLKINDEVIVQEYIDGESNLMQLEIKNRVDNIIAILVLKTEYTTQDYLAEFLQVSKSLIKLDMIKVVESLHKFELQLDKKAHYGITITGSLEHRKECILDLLEKNNAYVIHMLNEVVSEDAMKEIDKDLISLLTKQGLSSNYVEMMHVLQYIKTSIYMCKTNMHEDIKIEMKKDANYRVVTGLKESIMKHCKVTLCTQHVITIVEYLRRKTKPIKGHLQDDETFKRDIYLFLQEVDQQYQTSFCKDEEFKQSLLAHVSLLVDRLLQSISFNNPLVKEISVKYPYIFNLSIKFSQMLENVYQVKPTEDEIGFIATHFAVHMEKEYRERFSCFGKIAVICSSGGGSAYLIKLKLESLFDKSEIKTFSFMELESVRSYQPDIIFSIKELQEEYEVPIIIIKELLDDKDIGRIRNMFNLKNHKSLNMIEEITFSSLFHKNIFQIFDQGTYHEIINQMANNLEEQGYCDNQYHKYVFAREEVISTVYNNGVAIPHPIEMCGYENRIAIGIVKHKLVHENKPVKLVFLISLKKGDLKIHRDISRVLFDVMCDEQRIDKLHSSKFFEDFIKNSNGLDF